MNEDGIEFTIEKKDYFISDAILTELFDDLIEDYKAYVTDLKSRSDAALAKLCKLKLTRKLTEAELEEMLKYVRVRMAIFELIRQGEGIKS